MADVGAVLPVGCARAGIGPFVAFIQFGGCSGLTVQDSDLMVDGLTVSGSGLQVQG